MRVLVFVLAVLALGIASAASAAQLSTWSGTISFVAGRALPTHPSLKLAVGATTARADFSGITGAAHDPPTATTTCWIGYRFLEKRGSWRYFRGGRPHLTAAGYVQNSPCIGFKGTMRVRLLASNTLSVQFDDSFLPDLDEFRTEYAGRLHR